MKKMTFAVVIMVILFAGYTPALAEGNFERAVNIVADVTVVRPVGFACMVAGTAAYIVALPFAAAAGSVKPVTRTLVTSPFEFTFKRPVGDFSSLE